MDPKKLSIRLSAKGKKEEKAGKEDRRLAPMRPFTLLEHRIP